MQFFKSLASYEFEKKKTKKKKEIIKKNEIPKFTLL